MNNDENTAPARKYKRYDEAFKRSSVEHWMLSDKSARLIPLDWQDSAWPKILQTRWDSPQGFTARICRCNPGKSHA